MKARSEFKAQWSASLRIMTLLASAVMLGMPLFLTVVVKETRIELDDLETVELIEAEAIRGSVRVFGNGGLFAFCGWFWNRSLGRYRMWVTDARRLVLIRCGDRRLVVSPDNPQEFMAALLAGRK